MASVYTRKGRTVSNDGDNEIKCNLRLIKVDRADYSVTGLLDRGNAVNLICLDFSERLLSYHTCY